MPRTLDPRDATAAFPERAHDDGLAGLRLAFDFREAACFGYELRLPDRLRSVTYGASDLLELHSTMYVGLDNIVGRLIGLQREQLRIVVAGS